MMGHPNCLPFSIPLSLLAGFSADGCAYRAFDRLIVAHFGMALLVPLHLVDGDLSEAVDGCPVPWEEVHDIINTAPAAVHAFDFGADAYSQRVLALASLVQGGWSLDFILLGGNPNASAWRFTHELGIVCAIAGDLVYE